MFDLFPMLLSSVASFLFPIFASYKALKTSDPAQLTPWLMYWVVFSCCLLVESWFSFILFWVPFYGYIRLLFLLYLILPQTQGARAIYEERIHPFLRDNETHIDDLIASAHDRLKSAGISYLKQAIEFLKVNLLGLPPAEETHPAGDAAGAPQSYTSSLLARFSVPSARWAGVNAGAGAADFYSFLSSAVSTATAVAGRGPAVSTSATRSAPSSSTSSTLLPASLRDTNEKMSFIAAQRDRLNMVLSALDREAQQLMQSDHEGTPTPVGEHPTRAHSMSYDGAPSSSSSYPAAGTSYGSPQQTAGDEEPTQRPPSGLSMWSALSKSRSETDFEKIEADSGAEDEGTVRRRGNRAEGTSVASSTRGGGAGGTWMPWGWGGGAANTSGSGGPET